jgi:hypothetical protein
VQDEAPNGRPKRKRIATEAGAAVLLKAAQAAARRNPAALSTPPNERKTIPVSTGSSVSDEGDKNIRDDEVEVISCPRMCRQNATAWIPPSPSKALSVQHTHTIVHPTVSCHVLTLDLQPFQAASSLATFILAASAASRNNKATIEQPSSAPAAMMSHNSPPSSVDGGDEDEIDSSLFKKQRRREKNRASAQQSRQRKKCHLEMLEQKVDGLERERDELQVIVKESSRGSHATPFRLISTQKRLSNLPFPGKSQILSRPVWWADTLLTDSLLPPCAPPGQVRSPRGREPQPTQDAWRRDCHAPAAAAAARREGVLRLPSRACQLLLGFPRPANNIVFVMCQMP